MVREYPECMAPDNLSIASDCDNCRELADIAHENRLALNKCHCEKLEKEQELVELVAIHEQVEHKSRKKLL